MKHIFLLIFCISISLAGCRTHKATLTQDISTTEQVAVEVETVETEVQTVETEQSRVEEITIVEYSEPDTVGRQFITRITVKNSKDETLTKAVTENLLNVNEIITDEIKTTSNTNITQQTKTRTPAWIYLVGAIIIAGVLIFIYIVIKKIKN
jgi:CHASE3 domain sensor protein